MSPSHSKSPSSTTKPLFDESLAPWNKPMQQYLIDNHKDQEWDGIATACVVFNADNNNNKVLVLQRASHDSMPNKWELPGGAVDNEDRTILDAAARELFEEAGLVAKRFRYLVRDPNRAGGEIFHSRDRTKTWCRFAFRVEVESCDVVTLDPNEHQDFAWASEKEIEAQKMGDRELPITTESVRGLILEAFRLERKSDGSSL